MRKDVLGAIVGLMFVALLTFVAVSVYRGAERRHDLAISWSNDDFNFSATGDANRTFTADPIGYDSTKKQLACSLFVGSVVSDQKLSGELEEAGFAQIACNGQVEDLK
jgi:hypothetical protein